MRSRIRYAFVGIFCAGALLPSLARAQAGKWSWPGCPDVTDADFKVDTLMRQTIAPDPTLAEPDKMAFDMDAAGNVDIYFTEIRPGNIKKYSGKTKTVTTLATLPVWKGPYKNAKENNKGNNIEEGATGIVLDPNFKTNGWVYIHWSPASAEVFRISRFTIANNKLDLSTEKIVLQYEAQRELCCHTGGAMQFDAYGDLWITQGANGGNIGTNVSTPWPIGINEDERWNSEEWGAASTHGLRGSILRIHPTPDGKYTIPKDNFGEYFARTLNKPEYLDTSKVLPEIYIKGNRNDYSLALDPVRRYVAWGDVGPDQMTAAVREEFNFRKTPGFEGWPYFTGDNTKYSGNHDANDPVNNSKWNTGLTHLPPARGRTKLPDAFLASKMRTAPITGPYYLYDGDSKSTVKLPPHFNRKWFVTDYTGGFIYVFDFDTTSMTATNFQPFLNGRTFQGPVDFRQGPDGALYLSIYGTINFTATNPQASIQRITYTGSCHPDTPKLEQPVGIHETRQDLIKRNRGLLVNLGADRALKVPEDMAGLELFDIAGKQVWTSGRLRAGDTFWLPKGLQFGALKYRWISAKN